MVWQRRSGWLASSFSILALMVLAGCAGGSTESVDAARAAVAEAQADDDVVTHARDSLDEAEAALERAESALRGGADPADVEHLAYVAERRAGIALVVADERAALATIETLDEEREALLLGAGERQIARLESDLAALQAERTDRGLLVTLSDDLLFEPDRAELKPGGTQQLARLADFLRHNPDRNVLVEGHTDGAASDSFSTTLSQQRANAVAEFLMLQGVDPARVDAIGYGEAMPVATNDTVAGRQANRRVDIVVLDPGQPIPGPRPAAG